MLKNFPTYTSFTAKNLKKIKKYYADKLGVGVAMDASPNMVMFEAKGTRFMIYAKPDHKPASYTVLNFAVDDIEEVVDKLAKKRVKPEQYKDMDTNEKGIAIRGPVKVAWLKDPEGNVVGLSQGV